MKKSTALTLVYVTFFSIAMGYLESSVVVYIRAIYYPEGFAFPLKEISEQIAVTEIFREAATMIMLIGVAFLASKKAIERFAYFIFSFAIWDIFYYVFLKLLLNWPESFLTWDILFMLPVTWVGPVIAPVINSVMMIFLALAIIFFSGKKQKATIAKIEWGLLILGSLIVIYTYTEEFTRYMLHRFNFSELLTISGNSDVLKYACTYIPKIFRWDIFSAGVLMHLAAIVLYSFRVFKQNLIPGQNSQEN
jgi:hypothetical protein